MISTLELKQFRGLEHVKFEDLGRANLIIGGNNTGIPNLPINWDDEAFVPVRELLVGIAS